MMATSRVWAWRVRMTSLITHACRGQRKEDVLATDLVIL